MIYIYNRDEEQIDILDIKPKFTREIGKFNTLEFETIKEYEKGYRVVYQHKGKPYEFIIQEQDYLRDDMVSFSYFCKDSFVENEGVPILDKRPEGSYKVALNSVLEDTRWELVTGSDYSESVQYFNSFYQVSVLEAFAEIVDKYNLEWETSFSFTGSKITSRKIHIKKIGKQANSRLEFGKNIVKFERKILPENIVTALYGYGKGEETEAGGYGRRISFADINGGLAYVTNEEAKQKYGIGPVGAKKHIFDFFIDEEETDKTKLLESTKKELERVSQSQAEYTIEAVNLHIDCDYGDMVPAIDDVISFEGNTRIIKAIVEGDDLVFVFGHVVKGFTDSFQKEIKKSAEATEIKITSIMETRLNQIADIYFGEDGYNYDLKIGNEYGLPAGLYSFDAPIDEDPTKVIYFGAGKLLIADSKDPNGAWLWKTALDGQGIVGSSIVAHSITANKLAADVGQELDISSNVAITSRVSKTEILTDPEIQEALKGDNGEPAYLHTAWANVKNLDVEKVPFYTTISEDIPYVRIRAKLYSDPDFQFVVAYKDMAGEIYLWIINQPESLDYRIITLADGVVIEEPIKTYILTDLLGEFGMTLEDMSKGMISLGWNGSAVIIDLVEIFNITNFSTTESEGRTHIGTYTDFISSDSTDPAKYNWSLIKGADGKDGADGQSVSEVTTQYYLSTSKTSVTGGSWDTALPAWKKNTYIWTRLKIDYINPTKTEYTTEVLDTVNNALNEVYNSGIILPSQKPQLLIKLAEIVEEYKALNTEDNKKLDEWTAYKNATEQLIALLNGILSDMEATTVITANDFQNIVTAYESSRNAFKNAVNRQEREDIRKLYEFKQDAEHLIRPGEIESIVSESKLFANKDVETAVANLLLTVNGLSATVTTTSEQLSAEIKKTTNYLRFEGNPETNPIVERLGAYLEIGTSVNQMALRQFNNRIAFMDGSIELAYFANQAMNVDEVQTRKTTYPKYEFINEENSDVFAGYYNL